MWTSSIIRDVDVKFCKHGVAIENHPTLCRFVSMCNTSVCWKLCVFNATTRPSFRSEVEVESRRRGWILWLALPPWWSSLGLLSSSAFTGKYLPHNAFFWRESSWSGWKRDMSVFTFEVELCSEGWQDLVRNLILCQHFATDDSNPRLSHDAAIFDDCEKHSNHTTGKCCIHQPPRNCTFRGVF